MCALGHPPVMLDIIEEHFEELDFLWELREGVIFAPDWTPGDLAELEERAEAHLDGLRLAELHAIDIARPHLVGEHTFAATAATFVMMESGDPACFREVTDALANSKPDATTGLRIGLRHSRIEPIAAALQSLASGPSLAHAAAALDVLAFHRVPGARTTPLLAADDADVLQLAYGAAGRLGEPLAEPDLERALAHPDPRVQRAALEAAARSALPCLRNVCLAAATRSVQPRAEALRFVGVLGDRADLPLLVRALGDESLADAALRGLGALGEPKSIPLLIEAMRNPKLAAAAGAAFQRITGAEDIRAARPSVQLAAQDAIAAEFADDAPPPDPGRAETHWHRIRDHLPQDGLWQAGRAPHSDSLRDPVFDELPLAVRRDLYFRARSRDRLNTPDLELEARGAGTQRTG